MLERRIHNFINYGEGSWHVAQRDLIWVRISKEAFTKGVKSNTSENSLRASSGWTSPSLLDAVAVTLITDRKRCLQEEGRQKIYEDRDARIKGMRDNDVGTYYSCTLYQDVCSQSRLRDHAGTDGALRGDRWLDGKIAYEMSPSGANQAVERGALINAQNARSKGKNGLSKRQPRRISGVTVQRDGISHDLLRVF